MTCESCGDKPKKCNKGFTKAVIEIDNPEQITLMRRVVIPASMGDDTAVPPAVGKYKNVLLFYEANSKSYLYSSDGIPTLLANGLTDYEQAINLPQINGVTLVGNKTSGQLDLQPTLSVAPDTGVKLEDNELSGLPATGTTIGMVKPGDGLEVDANGTMSVSDVEQYAHFFDTVADMKTATNLVAGDYARTLGYYSANDGGGALYKIENSPSASYHMEIGSNLYATLIGTNINVDQLGANGGDNTLATYFDSLEDAQKVYPNATDLTEKIGGVAIQCAINYFWTNTIMLGEGTYYVNKPLTNGSATTLSLIGARKRRVTIKYTDVSATENSILELGSNAHRCVIENIDFVGPYDFPAVEDITQQLLESYNTNGIYLSQSTDNIIKNCTFDRCKSGVKASYSWCDTIESCWFIRNNIGYDSGAQSANNALRLESCIIEYNNYGAWIGEGRSQLVLNCDIERNIVHGVRKSNEGDIQFISTYFENDFVCYVDTTYTRNILFCGCSFYQNSNNKAFYVPITYDGEDDVTQVTVMNCNFIDGKSDVDYTSHYAIREYSGSGIKPVLMNNTTTRIKEFNPSSMRGISVNNGLLKEYRKRSFAVNNINATDGGTTTFDLVTGDDWRVNIPTSGTHSFKLPTVDTPDIYINHNFKFIIPAGNSTRTGTISIIPDDSSTCDIEGHTSITATDSAKMITATFIGNYSSKSHWSVTVSA